MKNRREKLEAIFEAAAALETDAQRSDYLSRACPDGALRAEVESLLEAMKHPDSLFDEGDTVSASTLEATPVLEQPGTMIGRYKLLQKVGEGGMGVVYMAEQTEPVTRKVALKIIKLGMDTKQVVARFEAERQALAMMDHPNIAKVLDAGATDTGRPYFVMELVRGVPITEYCDKNKLSTVERLNLFIPVCNAIQHAHQKGIIHRDIKPSNVMVTLNDGVPLPKVIDFGIAKATNQKLTEKTLFTNYAQMIGTPAYMSPEQAEMSALDVDTRTDVYSLGVLLYELLTGTTPFPSKELMSMGYGEMQKIIAEKEPPKPSTRMSTMQHEERTVLAKNRSMEASALGTTFQGDLDWIVMKALEKDRSHRYETANGLVADIKRHLNDEPVSAAAPTFSYQFRKFARRNKKYTRVAATVAGLLVVVTAFATFQAIRATRAEKKAASESVRGDAVARFMIESLEKSIPELIRTGMGESALQILADADAVAGRILKDAPSSEFALRSELHRYYRFLFSRFSDAAEQATQMGQLLETLDDGDLDRPRLEILAEITESRLWLLDSKSAEAKTTVEELESIAAMALENPATSGRAAAQCYASLGSWYYQCDEIDLVKEPLLWAAQSLPQNATSYLNQYVLKYIYYLQRRGIPTLEFEAILPDDSIPGTPFDPVLEHNYRRQLEYHWDALARSARYQDILSLLEQEKRKFADKGAEWNACLGLIQVLRARALLMSGSESEAITIAREVALDPKCWFPIWYDATRIAAMIGDPSVYEELRKTGIARFLSGNSTPFMFANTLLLRPLPKDLADVIRQVVERAEERTEWAIGGSRGNKLVTYAFLAFRQGDYSGTVAELDRLAEVRSERAVEILGLKQFNQAWDWRLLRAMALAQLDKTDEARQQFQEAMGIRKEYVEGTPPWVREEQDIIAREAEIILREKGILQP